MKYCINPFWTLLLFLLLIFVALLMPQSAFANLELAQKKVCLSCHGVEQRSGFPAPSFREVAQKYAGQNEAINQLLPKIMKGGTGVWGVMTMPANPQINEAEGRQLLQWILSIQ